MKKKNFYSKLLGGMVARGQANAIYRARGTTRKLHSKAMRQLSYFRQREAIRVLKKFRY